jgi:Spy/CpxP family protein refolding chaperone
MTLKSTTRKAILAGLFAVATSAVLVTAPVAAQQDGQQGGRRSRPGQMHRGFDRGFDGLSLRELDLTEAQLQEIRSIYEQNREAGRGVGDKKLRDARRALYEATVAESIDESAIRAAASALADAEAEAAISRARVRAQVWNVLTPEQQEKARSLRAERRERRGER